MRKTILTYRVVGFGLLSIMTAVMFAYASAQSFWIDELEWSIGKVAHMNVSEIARQLLSDGYNMPLYYYALAAIYPIVPFGEGYLLSISIIAVVAGIVILYFAARKIGGETLAFLTLCLASVSGVLMTQGGWECRPYAFYFCFSALTLLFYVKRMQRECWGNILGYGIALTLLMYSHWFGAVMFVFYGVCDLFLFARKKIGLRCCSSYLVAGAALLPWFLMMLLSLKSDLGTYWQGVPGVLAPVQSVLWLLSGNKVCLALFAMAALMLIVRLVRSRTWDGALYLWIQMLLMCGWLVGVTFVYSRLINPEGSIYVERYFFSLIPQVVLITAFGIEGIGKSVARRWRSIPKAVLPVCAAALIVGVGVSNYAAAINEVTSIYYPSREVAEYIAADERAYTDGTLVIGNRAGGAWIDYYFLKRGLPVPKNVAVGEGIPLWTAVSEGKIAAEDGAVMLDPEAFVKADRRVSGAEDVTHEAVLGYDRVIYTRLHGTTEQTEGLLAFLDDNYRRTSEAETLRTIVFEK